MFYCYNLKHPVAYALNAKSNEASLEHDVFEKKCIQEIPNTHSNYSRNEIVPFVCNECFTIAIFFFLV